MTTRAAAIALCLAALAPAGRALAEDDPSCAQYQEPMAYNDCLARHGPKANAAGVHSGAAEPERGGPNRAYESQAHAPATGFGRWPHAQRIHGRVHMEFQVR
jgi:hypothetical protein